MLMLSSKPKHSTSTQLKVIDDLHREEIEILNDFMRILTNSDDDQIDEWLLRLEGGPSSFQRRGGLHREIRLSRFKKHLGAHSETFKATREARKNWDEERSEI